MSIWGTGILKGMLISMRNMFRGPITVQYPKEKVQLPERARWAVEMKLDEDGMHKCTACMACAKACPDYIIDIETTTDEERNKHIDRWGYEIGACMMCGLCVESCPFDAIQMGKDYELARYDADELAVDLLCDVPAAKPKRKAAADKPAAARPAPAADKPASEVSQAGKPAAEKPSGTAPIATDPDAETACVPDPKAQGACVVNEPALGAAALASEPLPVEPACAEPGCAIDGPAAVAAADADAGKEEGADD